MLTNARYILRPRVSNLLLGQFAKGEFVAEQIAAAVLSDVVSRVNHWRILFTPLSIPLLFDFVVFSCNYTCTTESK